MRNLFIAAAVAALICVGTVYDSSAASGGSTSQQQQIARGEYLVKGIAGCGDCHTPMNEKGEPVMAEWLHGTKLFFAPTAPIPNWADTSVNIAGLPGWDDARRRQAADDRE